MHPRSPRRDRAARPIALLAVAAASAAACSTGPADVAAPETTAAAPTTTAPTTTAPPTTNEVAPATTAPDQTPEQEVLAAYQAFWDTWLAANDPPNPDHPGLRRYYTGPALEKALAEIQKNKNAGVSIRLPPESVTGVKAPSVSVDRDSAVIETCLVDDALTVMTSSGAVLDEEVVASRLNVQLVRSEAGWAVSKNEFLVTTKGSSCP